VPLGHDVHWFGAAPVHDAHDASQLAQYVLLLPAQVPARYWFVAQVAVQGTHEPVLCSPQLPDKYCPLGHVRTQSAQLRSIVSVQGVVSYCVPDVQVVQPTHVGLEVVLQTPVRCEPALQVEVQGVQTGVVNAVQLPVRYEPLGQDVVQVLQADRLAEGWNVPEGHVVH